MTVTTSAGEPVSDEELASAFAEHRPYLHAMAYRMLGSHADADDAVQEAWIRLARVGGSIAELRGWLTIATSRICLDLLRARGVRGEQPLEISLSVPLGSPPGDPHVDPEREALLAEEISLALNVVMDALTPAERVAFVLQDVFGVPFSSVAAVLGRSTDAAKMLASRARGKVRLVEPSATATASGQVDRDVIDAFFAAARLGDIDRLLDVLAPDVELQAVGQAGGSVVRGAARVAARAAMFARADARLHPVVVDGLPGVLITVNGRPLTVFAFTIDAGQVTAIKTVSDPRLAQVLPVGFTPVDEAPDAALSG
jgi:RNA polymerase sigma-70 factor, ECF subfamily